MELYIGLDVSLEETHICVMDRNGKKIKEAAAVSDPADLDTAMSEYKNDLERWDWKRLRSAGGWQRNSRNWVIPPLSLKLGTCALH
jgi:predicted NBD/HSP70 family sugar kinase